MEPAIRHRRSPSSDRFLDVFSFSPPSALSQFSIADEFNEAELFFTNDFSEPNHNHRPTSASADRARHQHHARRASYAHPPNSGILTALQEPEHRSKSQPTRDPPVLYRKTSISSTSSKPIPSIPRPPQSFPQSAPARSFQKSAPMKVPVLSQARDYVDDEIEEDEMLPPHEFVAGRSPRRTYSVVEGVGRTLKGRDLRLVRDAIWRQTGFLG